MKVLAIDSSGIVASIALLEEDKLIGEYTINNKRTHSQNIMPMVENLFKTLEMSLDDVDVFAAVTGPGSFTGLRIGVATIKAFAHAKNKPVVSVPAMEAMAYNIPYFDGIVLPMMDARRQRAYMGMYRWEGEELKTIVEQDVMEIEKIIELLKEKEGRVLILGDGIDVFGQKLKEELNDRICFAPKYVSMSKASSAAKIALEKAKREEMETYIEMKPNYLRKSQAERELEEKQKKE